MTNDPLVNNCLACDAFDRKTKSLVREFLSIEEITTVVFLLAATIKGRHEEMMKAGKDHKRRLMARQGMDFATRMVGKFLLSLEKEYADALLIRIQKTFGVALAVKHEECPHQNQPPGACL